MYTLTDDQIASVKAFIAKLPESIIRGKVEKWLADIEPTGRCDSDKMERFVEMSVHLPIELQYYPISFANTVKNTPETERREAAGEGAEKANLLSIVDESIEDVPDVEAPKDIEETEHKLGVIEGSKSNRGSNKKSTGKAVKGVAVKSKSAKKK